MSYANLRVEVPAQMDVVKEYSPFATEELNKLYYYLVNLTKDKENLKAQFLENYTKGTFISKESANRIVETLETIGSFNEEYLKDMCINATRAIYPVILKNRNIDVEELFYKALPQIILQESFFNRNNGVERWESGIQVSVAKKLADVSKLVANIPEFTKTMIAFVNNKGEVNLAYGDEEIKNYLNKGGAPYVFGANVITAAQRGKDLFELNPSIKNITYLTSNREVFVNLKSVAANSTNYNSFVRMAKKLTPEQQRTVKYFIDNNIPFDDFKNGIANKIIDEDYVIKNIVPVILKEQGISDITVNSVKSELKAKNESRVTTVGTLLTLLDNAEDIKSPSFVSRQVHVLPQFLQTHYAFTNPHITNKYNLGNGGNYASNLKNINNSGFAGFGEGIEEVNVQDALSNKEQRKKLEDRIKLICQVAAGSYNSYFSSIESGEEITNVAKKDSSLVAWSLVIYNILKSQNISLDENYLKSVEEQVKCVENNYTKLKKLENDLKKLKKVKNKVDKTRKQIKSRNEENKRQELHKLIADNPNIDVEFQKTRNEYRRTLFNLHGCVNKFEEQIKKNAEGQDFSLVLEEFDKASKKFFEENKHNILVSIPK